MQAGETTTAAPEACACGIYEPVDEPIKEMEIGMSDADDENTALPRQEASGQEDDLLTKTLAAISAENTPHNSIDWNEMGNSYTRSKKFNEAIEAYKKAIEMNPRYGQPYCNLGLIYYHLGKFDTAVLLFKKSTELLETREDKAASWNKLGDSYRRLGDYGAALAAYQKSSEMAPTVSPVMARARATLLENIVAG